MNSKKSRKAKSLRAARGGSRSRNSNVGKAGSTRLVMYKSLGTVIPDEFDTTLKYIVFEVLTSVGGTTASLRFRTEAFDVDPAIGSTAMPGFTEFAAFYARFRPLALGYKFSVANQEAFPLSIIHGFTTTSIASGSLGSTYAGNPLFGTSILGAKTGNDTGCYEQTASVTKIVGTQQPLFDDLYTGSTTSATLATAGTVYCNVGVLSPQVMTALGCVVNVEISLALRFYRRNPLLT